MKNILIIGAMEEEIRPLVDGGGFKKCEEKPYPYYEGEVSGRKIIVTVSQVGKVAMSSCVQHFITLVANSDRFDEKNIELVMNMGVAGAISSVLKQGDIVVADKLCQHDMDASGLGYELGLNPDLSSVYFETNPSVVEAVKKAYSELDTTYTLQVGTIASGDQFISSKEKKDFIQKNFDPLACEMEGAALAQTCAANGVDFMVIRSISDLADGEAPLSYNDFKEQAIVNLTELVKKYLDSM